MVPCLIRRDVLNNACATHTLVHLYKPMYHHTNRRDDWRDFFDVIIVSAGKPGFFTSGRPFRSIAQATGKIR